MTKFQIGIGCILANDPNARVACETSVATGLVLVIGEITNSEYVDIQKIVRQTIREIGYTRAKYGFDPKLVRFYSLLNEQSPDIAKVLTKHLKQEKVPCLMRKLKQSVLVTKV